jgi:lipopolysaccharide export system protein LptA
LKTPLETFVKLRSSTLIPLANSVGKKYPGEGSPCVTLLIGLSQVKSIDVNPSSYFDLNLSELNPSQLDRPMVSVPQLPHFLLRRLGLPLLSAATLVGTIATPLALSPANAQSAPPGANQALTLRSDVQEANAVTGVITARGNVQIYYPARQIQATSAQAQYYSRERRIILSGDVYVLQEGNSLRGETITYLIDEGRFVALPDNGRQVESIYLVTDPNAPTTAPATASSEAEAPFNPKPEFKTPISPP